MIYYNQEMRKGGSGYETWPKQNTGPCDINYQLGHGVDIAQQGPVIWNEHSSSPSGEGLSQVKYIITANRMQNIRWMISGAALVVAICALVLAIGKWLRLEVERVKGLAGNGRPLRELWGSPGRWGHQTANGQSSRTLPAYSSMIQSGRHNWWQI